MPSAGGYPGFFLGGCITKKCRSVFLLLFFRRILFISESRRSSQEDGMPTPLHFSPKSAPEVCKMTNVLVLETDVWGFGYVSVKSAILQTPLLS